MFKPPMDLKHKHPDTDTAEQANMDAANRLTSTDDASLSSSDEIIYTPPDSDDNMGGEGPQASVSASTDGMLTATLSPVPREAGAANVSVREYIYFLPYPLPPGTKIPYSIHLPHKNPLGLPSCQFEPTKTLVLTSPMRTFLDVRVYKPSNVDSFLGTLNQGNSQNLDWAFSGTSSSHPITFPTTGPKHGESKKRLEDETWENLTHSTWTHWVDSRFPVGTKNKDVPVDEGDMYPIAPDLTLEVGHAFHPALRSVKTHEEMWRDMPIHSTNSTGSKICVVLRVQADAAGVRGVVIRLGQYCQGLLVHGSMVTVERWEWKAGSPGSPESENWKREVRIGDGFLPCGVTFRPAVLAVGGTVKFGDFEWKVEEVWEWTG